MTRHSALRTARQWGAVLFGLVVSLVFLYVGLRGLKLEDVWEDMRGIRVGWVAAGAAIYFLAVWGRTWRWHYLLRSIKPVPLGRIFPIVVIATWATTSTRFGRAR